MEMENALKAPVRSPAAGKSRNSSGGPSAGRKGGREAMELCFHLLFLLCGVVAVAFVLFISIYLIVSGLPAIREIGLVNFLLGKTWAPTATTAGSWRNRRMMSSANTMPGTEQTIRKSVPSLAQ